MRVALAKLLTAVPDVLLLDEPTNHLDLDSVIWLESFLKGYAGAVLLVSHDRDFMNSMANRVVEIADRKLVSYTGNFEAFVRERAARAERTASAARNQAKRVAQVERFIERFRYKNTKAKQVQSRVKMLDRMERVQAPSRKRRAMKVGFPPPPRSGEVVAELEDVGFSYGEVGVYDGLDVTVLRGEKVALVGPNGAGKTTLLKLLAGALHPQDGHRRLGHNVSCGYFAQHAIEALEPRNRLVEELQRSIPRTADIKPRDLLGRFLFSGDDVDKPVSVLSGGERTRLAMAKLLCEPHNFLCLDEPTNHLDMESRDVLEDALEDYSGALVLITHDRHLIRSIANRIVEVTDGVVTSHPGDYESYLWRKTQQGQPPVEAVDAPRRPSGGAARERRREDADRRARLKTHRDAMKRVEAELETLTAKVTELESKLADPVHYADASFVTEASHEHGAVRARIAELEAEWDAAAQALAEAESSPEPEGAEPRRGAR
jgi:ATP-binding cassette subfamily F protein 3